MGAGDEAGDRGRVDGVSRGRTGSRASVIEPRSAKVRTYYVGAAEIDWNYASSGMDKMMGPDFRGYAKVGRVSSGAIT